MNRTDEFLANAARVEASAGRDPNDSPGVKPSMAQAGPTKPRTILIVEDEAIVRLELVDRFERLGLIAFAAQDADEAIATLDARPDIELLLTDIKMPGSMDGIRLAHYVRDRWPPVKIIVLSGRLHTQLAELPAASVFLSKPYDPEGLEHAIANMLNSDVPRVTRQRASLRG